jgi:hypothetical protein
MIIKDFKFLVEHDKEFYEFLTKFDFTDKNGTFDKVSYLFFCAKDACKDKRCRLKD